MENNNTKKVVIIGGGFAGINLAKKLKNKPGFEVLLVDKNNYHFFPPLIYQVATGFMEPSAISYPFRQMLRGMKNGRFRMGTLEKILPGENKIMLNNGGVLYDYLVLATGTISNFFGMENVEKYAIPMKTISDAVTMRNILLRNLEAATRTTDMEERRRLISIVVAGAGPTGVELSGMFAEMRKNILARDYPELMEVKGAEIVLVDGAPTVLAPMSEKSQRYTHEELEKMGVHIILNENVVDYKNDVVTLASGRQLETRNLIWSAGVTSQPFEGFEKEQFGRGRRLKVDAFNRVVQTANIFALGDTAIMEEGDPQFAGGHPQLAQPAIQQAKNLGENLVRPVSEWAPFTYSDKGSMAIIGSNKAVADIPKPSLHFNGFIAWFLWVFVHIMSLVTYKNRLRALYNWIEHYLRRDQSFRMIIANNPVREKTIAADGVDAVQETGS